MNSKLTGNPVVIYSENLPGNFDSCEVLRGIIVRFCKSMDFAFGRLTEIEMAVGEACINIVEHGYKNRLDSPHIGVVVKKYENGLEIILCDWSATAFPLDVIAALTPEEFMEQHRSRGLGVYLIRTCVDSIEHKFLDGQGNISTLVKLIKGAPLENA